MSTAPQTPADELLRASVARTTEWYEQRERHAPTVAMWSPFQENEVNGRCMQYRELARHLRAKGVLSLTGWRVLDVGCGIGRHVRSFLELGAAPEDVCGIEIRQPAIDEARRLSPHLRFELFDGIHIPAADGTFDLVTQHVCFSSILDRELRVHLAAEMWRAVRPGGHVFWWDFPATQGPTDQERGQPIDLEELFPGLPRADTFVGWLPGPDECARHVRGARVWRPLLRRLRHAPAFCASLIGPK